MDPLHPVTIIVSDDDEDDLALFREIFERDERFQLLASVSSGMEALNEISRKKNIPEVLLVDMYMPYFTGIDLVKALAELHAAPNMYKFVISTTSNIAENEAQLNSPYIIFLKKPVSIDEIRALPGVMLRYMQQGLERVS